MGGSLLAFCDHQRGRLGDRHAGCGDGAGTAGAVAETHEIAVVLFELDVFEGYAELRGKHLCERGGMTLAIVERSGGQFHRTVRLERNLAEFAAGRCRDFEIGADRDAAELAALAALLLAPGESGMIGNLERLAEYALE